MYLAALTSINPTLCEAAEIDGAKRLQKIWHITLPSVVHIVVLISILNLGHNLNAGFDRVFNMYNPLVYENGDILYTLTYRMGILRNLHTWMAPGALNPAGFFSTSLSTTEVSIWRRGMFQ